MAVKLPPWWPAWLPERCPDGHLLVPGRVTVGWTACTCPAVQPDQWGHRVIGCAPPLPSTCRHAWHPPGHPQG